MSVVTEDTNPFKDLHLVVRNEEDEIRKGVFSYVLRKLHGLSHEEKQRWCEAVRDSTPKRTATGSGSDPASLPLGIHKEKRLRGDDGEEPMASVPSTAVAPLLEAPPALTQWTAGEANEYILAYMRTLLDRVIGGSLSNLSTPALRVLCVMAGIHTHSRSKDVLYNILASFYFTRCEKLGKRVSKSTLVEKEIRQTSEMLMALPSNRSKTASVRRVIATADPQAAVPRTVEEKKRPVPAAKDPCAAPAAKKHTTAAATAATTTVHSSEAEDSEVLDIAYAKGVFATATHARPLQSSSPSSDSWEPAELERKVASIVQLYDPVTATMVVKKLNQMGYRDDGAPAVVEAILRRFHQRQLIFFDSDIAYLL